MTMRRDECMDALYPHIAEDVVVSVYSAAYDWGFSRPDHPLNYYCVGAMGLAPSHAMGLAFARPDRRVIVIDGDGSLLMNLGCLVTMASSAPPNLYYFLCANGTYEANGSHPLPGINRLNFVEIAKGSGLDKVYSYDDLADFKAGVGPALAQPGPIFVELKVEPGRPFNPEPSYYVNLYSAESRRRFKEAFQAPL